MVVDSFGLESVGKKFLIPNARLALNLGVLTLLAAMLSACAGEVRYTPPKTTYALNNTKTVERSKDDVWKYLIPELGKEFFVINNLDKDSGLINISYSGDPTVYIDCGQIFSYVQNARGKRTYDFPAAKANQDYETLQGELIYYNRRMSLEGRVNLIVQDVGNEKTLVSANTKYVVTKSGTARRAVSPNLSQSYSDTISFNAGGRATFPQGTICVSTGRLEASILDLVK